MTETQSVLPQPIRNFEWKVPIVACRLSREDMKRLHKIIEDKQVEDREDIIKNIRKQQPNESAEDFQVRRERVADACRTTITVTGMNGEIILGHGESFLDDSIIPERIATIYCDTRSRFAALLNLPRANWVSILLDFTSPPPLDWNPIPSSPTRNNSIYNISAQNEGWGTSLNSRLDSFLAERKTRRNWLHKQGAYDILVLVLGLPLALWAAARFGGLLIEGRELPSVLSIACYIYLFLLALNIFREIFSFARWTFPKVELISPGSSPTVYRAILAAILIGIVGSALWDAIKAAW
jgi:hypothetical protein